MSVCVCVSVYVRRTFSSSSVCSVFIIRNVFHYDFSTLSLSLLCRIGQEWSVSLSYFGWPWLWFAVSLNKYAPLPLLTLLVQQKSFAVLLLQHQKLIMSKQMFLFLKKKVFIFSKCYNNKLSGFGASAHEGFLAAKTLWLLWCTAIGWCEQTALQG